MSEQFDEFDDRVREHIQEFQQIIKDHFPEATFKTYAGLEPHHYFIEAYTDVDDDFEVLDLVGDRIVDILVDEGTRIHVIPMGSNHH
ncbi:MAG TPA: hypothetical protein ENJ31_09980 [Anaerolineae bacterium]|nr:hypothetical protein [Anaerolineae bacterium]